MTLIKNNLVLSVLILLLTFSSIFSQNNTNTNTNTNTNNTTQQSQNPNLSNQNFKINSDAGDLLTSFNQQHLTGNPFKSVIVDKAVNENNYLVGPNDVFSLGIYGFLNQQLPITVNVEGSVLIPTIGEIKIDGLTLKDAKNKVISAVKKRYYSSDVSFTLVTPKTFLVTVSSIIQKQIEVNSTNRVSDLITYVYYDTVNVQRALYSFSNSSEFFKPTISMRNIEVVHKDGSISDVDLYKYFYTNDDKYNPYLKEGDYIKVPLGLLYKNYITINGAVQLPGVYEYNKTDDLETLIGLARGFDFDAYKDSIVIYRTNTATGKFESIYLIYDNNKNFKINEYDRVFVKYKADYVKNYSVSVLGEVNIPGVYPIAQKNTRLKDVIEMAGGLKHSAYLPLSIVFRRYDEEYMKRDTAEILINMRANDLIISEKDKLSFERDVISRRNRMVVDFEKLYMDNDSSQNIILEHQDVVYINDDKKIVYVYGQVENEGYVPFKPGEDFEYYIKRAGGYTLAADGDNTRIIKFNSRGWYKPEDTKILSGDFVYVPKKTPAEFKESLTIIATMIGVLASILTTTLLILQQNK